jgi:hypothetical protein
MRCCDRTVAELATGDSVTTYAHEVTCNDREIAELVVDTDGGESPFGWRETSPEQREATLLTALRTVRRQCAAWTLPTSALTWDARNRDLGVAVAAGVLLALIDHYAPGIDEGDNPEEVIQRPALADRFAAVLASTPSRASSGLTVPPHEHGGAVFFAYCALCAGDVEALAAALARVTTGAPLPHLGGL